MKAAIQLKSPITRRFKAHAWLENRDGKARSQKGRALSKSGTGHGPNYFTSRAAGSVTAHGYVRARLLQFQLTHHLSGIESIRAFIDDHCHKQHLRNQKILGLRFRISLDSKELLRQADDLVDVDRMFERVVEEAFKNFARRVYSGDEIGFFMGIHCYAKPSRGRGGATSGVAQPKLPGLHAHLFVFPETRQGHQLNFNDQTVLGLGGKPIDLLHELWFHYRAAILGIDHALRPWPIPAAGQRLRFIAREAILSAVEDAASLPEKPPEERHQSRIDSALACLKTLDRNRLFAHFRRRKQQVEELRGGTERQQLFQNLLHYLKEMEGLAPTFKYERDDILALCLAGKPHIIEPNQVAFFDINGLRPVLHQKPQVSPDQSPDVRKIFQRLQRHRQDCRLLIEAQKALADLNIAALTEVCLPDWVEYLDEMTRSATPPHQHFLDLGRDPVETSGDEYSIPAKCIDRPKP
jgi:hypothetical protein